MNQEDSNCCSRCGHSYSDHGYVDYYLQEHVAERSPHKIFDNRYACIHLKCLCPAFYFESFRKGSKLT